MRLRNLILFLLLLIPSAYLVSRGSDMPEFGKLHDDGLFFVSAKSLATGHGFRILSLPEQPAQTKYPILYPLYLSLIWRINPHFPENLNLASWFSWVLLAISLALVWLYWRDQGWNEARVWVIVGILAINPYMILFGCSLFSEIFFLCWLLASLIVSRKEGLAMALLAGVLAGLAYLSRTAGIALLISVPAWYLIGSGGRREYKRALAFAAGMLPFILGWTIWCSRNRFPATTPTLIYYTDYVKFQFLNVGWDNLPVVLWKNTDQLLFSMGSLFVPEFINLLPVKILTQVVAIAMIAGTIRLVRRGIAVPYALFALVSCAILVVWHFPPNPRFVGGVFAAFILATVVAGIALQLLHTFKYMPEQARGDRARNIQIRETYAWVEQHLPPSAGILSNNDPPLYLYSGHPGNLAPLLTRWWYADDNEKFPAFYRGIIPYCRTRDFQYVLATPDDMSRWSEGENQKAVAQALNNSALEPIYRAPNGAIVFQVR
jgi:hypothetical protein